MKRAAKIALAILFGVLGCAQPTERCIQSHQEPYTYTSVLIVGKVLIPTTNTGVRDVCDLAIRVDTLTRRDIPHTEFRP